MPQYMISQTILPIHTVGQQGLVIIEIEPGGYKIPGAELFIVHRVGGVLNSITGVISYTEPTISPVGLSNDYFDLDNIPTSFKASSFAAGTVPATASSTGTAGQIAYDSNYVYVCVATDTWKRTALSTW